MHLTFDICVVDYKRRVASSSKFCGNFAGNGEGESFAAIPVAGVIAIAVDQGDFNAFFNR